MLVVLLATASGLVGCATRDPKVCNPADAAKLTAEYVAKVHILCQGSTFDRCTARPALEAELNRQLEAACPTH